MNTYLEACLSFHFPLGNMVPILSTEYTCIPGTNKGNFDQIKSEINNCDYFTKLQKEHFCKCLNYLIDSTYKLNTFHSLNIVSSTWNSSNKYYCEFINTEYVSTVTRSKRDELDYSFDELCIDNICDEKKNESAVPKIFLNYNPDLFGNNWDKLISASQNMLPFAFFYSPRFDNNVINIVTVPPKMRPKFKRLSLANKVRNIVTIINFFGFTILNTLYRNPNLLEILVKHPFYTTLALTSNGILYSCFGLVLSKCCPLSDIFINFMMLCFNMNLIRKLKN